MKLLFTGSSGFLGKNMSPILEEIYDVTTMGLMPQDDYIVNLSKEFPLLHERYDIVLHAAGKAHLLPNSKEEEQAFFDVNLEGTKNLCYALDKVGAPRVLIFVSTVAVYGCDYGENITEEHPLNGTTPYAMSKRLAEEYLECWCEENNVILGILRPSLIAGPNPPGNLGAMINGIRNRKYFSIANSKARKSVLMAQDIANLIPLLAKKGGIYNVCDTYQPTFRELEAVVCRQLESALPFSIPYWIAKGLAFIGDFMGGKIPINSLILKKITNSLTFSNEKIMRELGWKPISVLDNFRIQ